MNVDDLVRLGAPRGEPAHCGVDFVIRFVLSSGNRTRLRTGASSIRSVFN